jgi:hypothetical protein
MSEPKETEKQPAAPAETASQEGAPDIVNDRTGKPPSDTVSDGAVDVSDPKMAADVTEVADQVHANA